MQYRDSAPKAEVPFRTMENYWCNAEKVPNEFFIGSGQFSVIGYSILQASHTLK